MLFKQETVAQSGIFLLDFQPYHKAFPSVFLQHTVQLSVGMESRMEIFSDFGCILYKVLVFYHIEYCQCCRTCQMVSSESRPEHAVFSLDRETVAHSFGCGDDVRHYAGILVCEEFSGAPVTGLYLVQDQHCTGCGAECPQFLEE